MMKKRNKLMNNKKIADSYIQKIKVLIGILAPLQSTDEIYDKVRSLVVEMQEEALKTEDEMLHPMLYNAAATIATAPESCSVRQLSEALNDAVTEMELMEEYL